MLTPVSPWRFFLVRLAGRLKGVFLLWAVTAVLCLLGTGLAALGSTSGISFVLLLLLALVIQLDTVGMLLMDAATGLRHSAASATVTGAFARTYLAVFLLEPLSMNILGSVGDMIFALFARSLFGIREGVLLVTLILLGFFAARLAIGWISIAWWLGRAHAAIEELVLRPDD